MKKMKQEKTLKSKLTEKKAGPVKNKAAEYQSIPSVFSLSAPASTARTETKPKAKAAKLAAKSRSPQITIVEAKVNVGFGNALYIRGTGDGLSWDKGVALECRDNSTWVWSTQNAGDKIIFKLLLNDQVWALGEDLSVQAGRKVETTPVF